MEVFKDGLPLFEGMFQFAVRLLQYALFAFFLYQMVISSFGLIKRKEEDESIYPEDNKFALIIAAHNEEIVVGNIVSNLKCLDYPGELYDIYVIADNCTDNTALAAREKGAVVFERTDAEKRGKGYAIEWTLGQLSALDGKYDAICIFDADNLVSSNFLKVMNSHLHKGHKVVQAYLDSKNPYDSWISCNYSAAYWISNRIFQLPRYYLGLSCALGGTGFMASMDLIREIGWNARCLTEDLEFSIQLVLKGEKVYWAHNAAVYDEKPMSMQQSLRQRKRWMQGQADCTVRYIKALAKKAMRDKDTVAFDCILYLLQPMTVIAGTVMTAVYILGGLLPGNAGQAFNLKDIASMAATLLLTYSSIIFIILENKFSIKIIKHFLLFPVYGVSWIPAIIQGYMNRKGKEWAHTVHTRAISITDMENFKKAV